MKNIHSVHIELVCSYDPWLKVNGDRFYAIIEVTDDENEETKRWITSEEDSPDAAMETALKNVKAEVRGSR